MSINWLICVCLHLSLFVIAPRRTTRRCHNDSCSFVRRASPLLTRVVGTPRFFFVDRRKANCDRLFDAALVYREGWRETRYETTTTFQPGLLSLMPLMPLDRIFVDREPDGIEVLRDWNSEKRYRVADTSGELLYQAIEESSSVARCCLGKYHAWDFHLVDKNLREVLRVSRSLRCTSCCFPCCLQRATVHADGELLGSVTQNWNAWRPSFTICDASGTPVLLMKGPICLCCGGEVDFIIKSIDKQHSVGVITKKWTGLAREFFKDGNSFGVGFPVDLDVKIKAVLLGACFLVDFIYFEEDSNMKRLSKPKGSIRAI